MKAPVIFSAFAVAAIALSCGTALADSMSGAVVGIEATVPDTSEPAPHIRVIPGEFTIRRTGGDLEQTLPVWLMHSGTATPGHDYAKLPDRVEFAPGEDSLVLKVHAVDDDEVEEDETVIVQVVDVTLGPIPLFDVEPAHESATVTIHDSDGLDGAPLVSIEATRPIAEETAAPLRRINLVGEFTVSRSGSLLNALPVWILASGTATPRADYEALPLLVRIPAGEKSVGIPVTALFDQEPEGIETVIATVSNCPPEGLLGPCYEFPIDPSRESATVFIREDGLSVATLHLSEPANGDQFDPGEAIRIRATAIHLESYLSRVEFWAGESRIGVSEIVFVRAPDPGTPIHHEFLWQRAPAGVHVLTARAKLSDPNGVPGREPLVSNPVRITVGRDGEPSKPEVGIITPASGEHFPAGEPIEIVIHARDPNGYIPQVELFADDLKIGELNIAFFTAPPPGLPQTFPFTWDHPLPGDHVLTARVTDNDGESADSAPVSITVIPRDARPLVTVVAADALAVEPGTDSRANPATFRINRHGSRLGDLVVQYSLGGQAENGVDYERLSGIAVIPSESRSVDVTILPLGDDENERSESVKLELSEDPSYLVGRPSRAFAVIRDQPWTPGPSRCLRLPDGLMHLCFPAQSGICFRLEESSDLQRWSTIVCLLALDGAIHFVDQPASERPRRFFRIAPEPNGLPGEIER